MIALSMQSNRPRDLALVEVAVPEPGPHQLRLKVHAVGICGSDVSAALAKPNFDWVQRPLILGHELSGEIDAAGSAVEGWDLGQSVSALSVQGCLRCGYCLAGNTQQCRERTVLGLSAAGAMADYCVVAADQVVAVRHGLSHLYGALIEPLAVASRCVQRACEVGNGDTVVVSGCGIIGLLCALVSRGCGADVTITGIAEDEEVRLAKARELGFSTMVVSNVAPLASQLVAPVDVVIEASGAPGALSAAPDALKAGGLIGVVATYPVDVHLSATDLVRAEQQMHTSFGSTRDDYGQAMDHLAAGLIPVEDLVETFPLDQAIAAFDASIEKRTPKAILIPQSQQI